MNRLQSLIWILLYGGLLTLVLGLSTQHYDEAMGLCLALGGGAVAAMGLALIFVRARLTLTETS